jgi:transposase InsO family protein
MGFSTPTKLLAGRYFKLPRLYQRLIVHFDIGSQYCSNNYYQIVEQHKLKGSMSRRSNCFDYTLIKKFSCEEHCSARKNEPVYYQDYKTRFEAISDITKYIELDYNRTRIQKGLGCRSPRQVWFDFYRQAA